VSFTGFGRGRFAEHPRFGGTLRRGREAATISRSWFCGAREHEAAALLQVFPGSSGACFAVDAA